MRNYEYTYEMLRKHIITPFEADVFIHTWSNKGCSVVLTSRSPQEIAKKEKSWEQYDKPVNEDQIRQTYTTAKSIVVEDFFELYKKSIEGVSVPQWILDKYTNRIEGTVPDGHKWATCHVHSFLPMFYKIMKCNQLKTIEEQRQNFKYDMVIRMRSDLIVGEIPNECLDNLHEMWCNINIGSPPLPNTNGQSQVSDRYALSNSDNMDKYCSVFNYLNVYWQDKKDHNPEFESWDFPVGDRLLRMHLLNMGLDHKSFKPFAPIYRS